MTLFSCKRLTAPVMHIWICTVKILQSNMCAGVRVLYICGDACVHVVAQQSTSATMSNVDLSEPAEHRSHHGLPPSSQRCAKALLALGHSTPPLTIRYNWMIVIGRNGCPCKNQIL